MGKKNLNILAVDDSKSVHNYLELCKNQISISLQFHHLYNAEEALSELKKNAESFDCILLDWELPGLSGIQALEQIIQLAPHLPVIMVTSKNRPEDLKTVLEKGATEYIMKPFTPDILQSKLEQIFGESFVS